MNTVNILTITVSSHHSLSSDFFASLPTGTILNNIYWTDRMMFTDKKMTTGQSYLPVPDSIVDTVSFSEEIKPVLLNTGHTSELFVLGAPIFKEGDLYDISPNKSYLVASTPGTKDEYMQELVPWHTVLNKAIKKNPKKLKGLKNQMTGSLKSMYDGNPSGIMYTTRRMFGVILPEKEFLSSLEEVLQANTGLKIEIVHLSGLGISGAFLHEAFENMDKALYRKTLIKHWLSMLVGTMKPMSFQR